MKEKDDEMDFDMVLEEIGEFGRYQKTNYMLICLPVLFAAANSLSYVFTAGIPDYRCLVPECDHHILPTYNEPWTKNAIPVTIENKLAQCEMFEKINETLVISNECPAEWFSATTIKCDKWVFDDTERTIVNDWKITCSENEWMLALIGTAHFAGIIVGSGAFGVLADNYGRKIVFIFCILFMSVTGIGQALAQDYTTFIVFAFLNAVGTSGVYPLAFIIGVEMVGSKKREMSGIVLNYFYALGEAAVGLAAWLSKDWVILQYACSAPPLLFILYYWLVPESVRWLLAKKYNTKAGKIIQKAARVNGVELSENVKKIFDLNTEESDNEKASLKGKSSNDPNNKTIRKHEIYRTYLQILKSKKMAIRTIILFYIWAANAFIFYGLSLNSTNLSGNKYLNFILVCLVEIPGCSLSWIAMNKLGRRWALTGSLLLCAITCVTGGLILQANAWVTIVLFLTGKMGITSSFAIVYVHTAEMLPTIVRSGGVGIMSTIARFGALVAPFVSLLGRYYKPLPLLLFGGISLFGGFLALILPETLGQRLPDTVDEAERLGKKNNGATDINQNTHL